MLTFSHEIINFNYAEKGHLQCEITVANRSMTPIYFKVLFISSNSSLKLIDQDSIL